MHWPAEAIWEAVAPRLPGFTVEILPEVGSTNTELMQRARAGATEPLLLAAERQTAGRGRLGRSWNTAAGPASADIPALTFSLGLPLAPRDWSGLSLAVGLSLASSFCIISSKLGTSMLTMRRVSQQRTSCWSDELIRIRIRSCSGA